MGLIKNELRRRIVMKVGRFLFPLSLILISILHGQPNIQFDEKVFDFGEAPQRDSVVHIFKFVNTGDETLRIEKVRSTCGCTAALLSSKLIPPGGKGEIKAVFKTGSFKGKVTKRIKVHTNDPDDPLVTLAITGRVKTGIYMSEDRIFFGNVPQGEKVSTEIILLPDEGDSLVISEVTGKNLDLKLTPYKKDGKYGYKLKVTLNTEGQRGVFFSFVKFQMEKPRKGVVQIPVNARIMTDIEVLPEAITLGMISPDTIIVRKVMVSNFSSMPLEITDIKWDIPEINVDLKEVEKGKTFELTLMVQPTPTTSFIKGEIKLFTNSKKMPEISIPVYGMIK